MPTQYACHGIHHTLCNKKILSCFCQKNLFLYILSARMIKWDNAIFLNVKNTRSPSHISKRGIEIILIHQSYCTLFCV